MQKFGTFLDPRVNSFEKTLANKWSSIQIKPGLLNTLRFVYKPKEILDNPIVFEIASPIQVEGIQAGGNAGRVNRQNPLDFAQRKL